MKIGASVQITSDVDQRVRSQGRVREIQPQVNDQRREATVKIDLPPTTLLKPGMFASAAITTDSGMPYLGNIPIFQKFTVLMQKLFTNLLPLRSSLRDATRMRSLRFVF